MLYPRSHPFGFGSWPAGQPRDSEPIEVLVRRLRLTIGIAAVLLLIAYAALGERSAPESSTDVSISQTATPPAPVFNSRDKWRGGDDEPPAARRR